MYLYIQWLADRLLLLCVVGMISECISFVRLWVTSVKLLDVEPG